MSKRYLDLRYRAEILTLLVIEGARVHFFYSHPEPHHGRREEHPHEAHQADEIFIKYYNIYIFKKSGSVHSMKSVNFRSIFVKNKSVSVSIESRNFTSQSMKSLEIQGLLP